jgi:hypothetical protein
MATGKCIYCALLRVLRPGNYATSLVVMVKLGGDVVVVCTG